MTNQWVIFTDLDGTLLERETYSYAPARQALALIRRHNIPLVLNSSKTLAEILALRAELGNQHPFVVENGAAVIVPAGYFADTASGLGAPGSLGSPVNVDDGERCHIVRFSQPHEYIIEVLHQARALGFKFSGFSDWSISELADISGLSTQQAALAKQRTGSEPLLLEGDLATFTAYLADHQLRVLQGGRFLHVMGQYDKADGVVWLLQAFRHKYSPQPIQSVALGDSHNDEGMLNAVDIPVIIKSPHSKQIVLTHNGRALFSSSEGPAGWNDVLLELLPD